MEFLFTCSIISVHRRRHQSTLITNSKFGLKSTGVGWKWQKNTHHTYPSAHWQTAVRLDSRFVGWLDGWALQSGCVFSFSTGCFGFVYSCFFSFLGNLSGTRHMVSSSWGVFFTLYLRMASRMCRRGEIYESYVRRTFKSYPTYFRLIGKKDLCSKKKKNRESRNRPTPTIPSPVELSIMHCSTHLPFPDGSSCVNARPIRTIFPINFPTFWPPHHPSALRRNFFVHSDSPSAEPFLRLHRFAMRIIWVKWVENQ